MVWRAFKNWRKERRRRRKTAAYTRKAKSQVAHFEGTLTVSAPSRFTSNTYLGANTHFRGMKIYGSGKVTIGSNFHCGPDCAIRTENHNHEGEALPYDTTFIVKDVSIGDNVWLGERVLVLPGARIGEGAIIQARSVVVGEIPARAIAGGHPCRPFAWRDKDKYDRLKAAGKFV